MQLRTRAERSARSASASRPLGQKKSRSWDFFAVLDLIDRAQFPKPSTTRLRRVLPDGSTTLAGGHDPSPLVLVSTLHALNRFTNTDEHPGESWMSVDKLCARVRIQRSAMKYVLRALERFGCVDRREPGYKGRATATYILRIRGLQAIAMPVDEKVKSRQRSSEFEQLDDLAAQELEQPSAPQAADELEPPAPVSATTRIDSCDRELEPSTGRESDTWAIWLGLYRSGLKVRWGDDAEYPLDRVPAALREQMIVRTHGLAKKYARNNETRAESVERCVGRLLVHYFKRERAPLLQRHHPLEYIDGDLDVIFADVGRELKRAAAPEDVRFVEVPVFSAAELAAAAKPRAQPMRRTLTTRNSCAEVLAALAPTGTGGVR